MTQTQHQEWSKLLKLGHERPSIRMFSGFSRPSQSQMLLSIAEPFGGSMSAVLSKPDVEWLANQCLEWLRLHAKAQTEWGVKQKEGWGEKNDR